MKTLLCAFLVSSFCFSLSATEPVKVTVLGDRVNLRNDNSLESDVVSQADYGQVLEAVSIEEKWVQVKASPDLAVWVYAPLLFEDREVRAPELNLRSGPGTQFDILGELKRGHPVTVLESLQEWRRIEVPDSVTLWISREFVQLPPEAELPEAEPEPDPTPEPAPLPTPITIVEVKTIERIVEVPVPVTPTPLPKVEAPEGLSLVPLKGQGTLSKRRGLVRAYLLAGGSPSRFMLVRPGEGSEGKSLCYLIGDEELLKQAAGKTVTVSGHDFWVTGQRLPVTKVEKIEMLPESP
ncbi:MAG: SH3 domain-containing protein [Kiritimatiellia bacterium]